MTDLLRYIRMQMEEGAPQKGPETEVLDLPEEDEAEDTP